MRKLASIQVIDSIVPIEGADKIELVKVLGWQCVTKKGEFSVGDLCVYIEIDSILPDKEEFDFLLSRKFRIRTIKLRKQLSQGICFPLSILPDNIDADVDVDVTDVIGVKKYDPEEIKGKEFNPTTNRKVRTFPTLLVRKTGEPRIQSIYARLVPLLEGKRCYISEKIDGTSATFVKHNKEYFVCSRNNTVKYFKFDWWSVLKNALFSGGEPTYKDVYNKINDQLSIQTKMIALKSNYAVQGEIYGPAIQKNKLCEKSVNFKIFNVYDIDAKKYLNYKEFISFCGALHIPTVDIITDNFVFNSQVHTLDYLLEMATGNYKNTKNPREGIVIRPIDDFYCNALQMRMSFKVINNEFLLKDKG